MPSKPRVALIVETSSRYGRDVLGGIVRFMRIHQEWSVFLEQRSLTAQPPSWLSRWKGDGIISRATTPKLVESIAETGVPFVELTDRSGHHGLPHIWSDDAAIGRLGAEHLLERGFKSFAFCGFRGEAWSERRQVAFSKLVGQHGYSDLMYESSWSGREAKPWEQEQQQLIKWIRSLPTPTGIMACNDVRGQHVLDACAMVDLAVPEEIAVIGCDNDDLLCQLANPPLSSVIPNPEFVGYRAAEILSKVMAGETLSGYEELVEPLGVATRQSTDVFAIDDADVASAVRYIRENACAGITVADVLKHVPLSRSALERRFRKFLKRSLQMEIRNVQLKRVKQLLAETDIALDKVAYQCGFQHPEYMHVVFKREIGKTPGQYRRQAQP